MARKETSKEILGLTKITKKRIQQLCKKDKLYQTPELNDVLYLHYQGIDCIECLEDYTELKCLWLECNAISEIQGLSKQTKLKCLFLQSNLIKKIENLEYCKELDTLNLSQNHIRKIENCGFEVLPVLNTLNLASNYLKDCESLKELVDCKKLSVLDLSSNRIDDILVVKIFSQMPELKVLVLQGNPVVSKIPQYRKTLILECENLTYLDSRPVFPRDRACAEAWKRGGYAEERKENERWNRKDRKKMRDSVNATINLRNKYRKFEDQISHIPSSDSEDEIKPQMRNIKIHLHSESSTDSIWDEVTEGQNLNNYSITNNGNQDENCDTLSKNESNEKEEVNDTMIQVKEVIKQHQIEEQHRVLEITESELKAEVDLKEQEEHSSLANLAAFEEVVKNEQCETEDEISKVCVTLNNFNESPQKNFTTTENLKIIKHPDFDQQLSVPLDSVASPLKRPVEECDTIAENVYDNYDVFKELEEKMTVFSQEANSDQGSYKFEKEKSSQTNFEEAKDIAFETIVGRSDRWDNHSEMRNTETNTGTKTNEHSSNADFYIEHQMDLESNGKANVLNESTSNLENLPVDLSLLTRRSNEALIAFEKETKVLKTLLDKLENRNENIFKETNLKEKNEKEDESYKNSQTNLVGNEHGGIFQQNIEEVLQDNHGFYDFQNKETIEEESIKNVKVEVVESILAEILQSLDVMPSKQNSFKFPYDLTENEQDFDVITNLKQPEKTLAEVMDSFNQLFNALEAKQGANKNVPLENSDKQIPLSVKKLPQKPNLKQFNNDTLQNLNAQLEKIKKDQHKKVRRIVDRVYAQKDRYNDTLELVDNKLMVRKQVTNELQELPKPLRSETSSDSEDGYDTALSETDDTTIEAFKSFKPKPRKSSEDLVFKAFKNNEQMISNDESEESTDEFHSLDVQEKSSLYKIDEELFKNLNFDLSNLTQQDEDHIVQCAASYEELRHGLTLNKEESSLMEQEKKLLKNMGKKICCRSDVENLQSDTEDRLYKDQQKTSQLEEKSFDKTVTKLYLRDISKSQESKESKCHEKTLSETQQSEEGKIEIEDNADIEIEAACQKLFECKNNWAISNNVLKEPEDKKTGHTPEQPAHNYSKTEAIVCTLEVFSDNDEIMDTTVVSADIHFD